MPPLIVFCRYRPLLWCAPICRPNARVAIAMNLAKKRRKLRSPNRMTATGGSAERIMSERGFRHSCGSRDGFIVVAALWILSALAALASVYSIYVANVATSVAVNDDMIRAEVLL